MLQSALQRPVNKWQYEQAALPDLAAAYAYGLAKNHTFVDGNKRIAFMVMMVFLRRNGVAFAPEQSHVTRMIIALAAGEVSEESLARWIRDNWPKAAPVLPE
jgi:death-on-curing protein